MLLAARGQKMAATRMCLAEALVAASLGPRLAAITRYFACGGAVVRALLAGAQRDLLVPSAALAALAAGEPQRPARWPAEASTDALLILAPGSVRGVRF